MTMIELREPTLETLTDPLFSSEKITLRVLRLDKMHSEIGGNKWFKLKYNLDEFRKLNKKILVTTGGAFSNHLLAVASAAKALNIPAFGIVRGEELKSDSNPLLQFVSACGMKLYFIKRDAYRRLRARHIPDGELLKAWGWKESEMHYLPEGGSNELAIKGCVEIASLIPPETQVVCCACGTGATLAGLTLGLQPNQAALGIAVLKGNGFLEQQILNWNGGRKNFTLEHRFSFGGYHASAPELESFCSQFNKRHQIPIEPIYTGKMFFGLMQLIATGFFPPDTRIVAIHTGGLFTSGIQVR